jgi:tRNA-binding EMAP/Myf-like protein
MGDVAPDQSRREDASVGLLDVDAGVGDSKPHFVRQHFLELHHSSSNQHESYYTFHSASDGVSYQIRHPSRPHQPGTINWNDLPEDFRQKFKTPEQIAYLEIHKSNSTAEPTLALDELSPDLRAVFDSGFPGSNPDKADPPACDSRHDSAAHTVSPSKRSLRKQERIAEKKELRKSSRERAKLQDNPHLSVMSSNTKSTESASQKSPPAQHKPLVVGRTKPKSTSISSMEASSIDKVTPAENKAELNHEIEKNLSSNTDAAAPAGEAANLPKKKEKAPKQPKPPKAAPAAAPLSPAIIDLRVGHILRAINHPNADSLYVSTIAMGDPQGTEHTQVDEETGKVVRTVCSGLNGLVPLAEMQDRRVVVVANLKPVNMRSIKSAAMVLAASPPAEEGADSHAADRVVELVNPPEGAEAGDKVFFEGWPYGEGLGPEKQLNPKKKQWEAIQPGFFTSDELLVGFDAGKSEVEGSEKGMLAVEGKGKCTVKTLKGAVVR